MMTISARELEILKLMCNGLTSKAIANQLSLTRRTVDTHRYNIGKKTGCTSSAQLGVWAMRNGHVL